MPVQVRPERSRRRTPIANATIGAEPRLAHGILVQGTGGMIALQLRGHIPVA